MRFQAIPIQWEWLTSTESQTFPIFPPSSCKSLPRAYLTRDDEENFWKISIRSTAAGKTWHEKIQEYKIRKTEAPKRFRSEFSMRSLRPPFFPRLITRYQTPAQSNPTAVFRDRRESQTKPGQARARCARPRACARACRWHARVRLRSFGCTEPTGPVAYEPTNRAECLLGCFSRAKSDEINLAPGPKCTTPAALFRLSSFTRARTCAACTCMDKQW